MEISCYRADCKMHGHVLPHCYITRLSCSRLAPQIESGVPGGRVLRFGNYRAH